MIPLYNIVEHQALLVPLPPEPGEGQNREGGVTGERTAG